MTVKGRNLQHVTAITFAGTTTVDIKNATATEFTLTVPATLASGTNTVQLTLSNGEIVEVGNAELSAPECAYATVLPEEGTEINAGETMVISIANADKLTGVKVNGNPVQYILNGDRLIIQIPESAGKNSKLHSAVSSNGEISYDIAVIPATHVENVIFNQVIDLSWSGDEGVNKFRIYKESFDGVPSGAKLVFHISPAGSQPQIQVNDANWGHIAMPSSSPQPTPLSPKSSSRPTSSTAFLPPTTGWSTTALIVQGQECVVSKVHVEWENSLETTIWDAGLYLHRLGRKSGPRLGRLRLVDRETRSDSPLIHYFYCRRCLVVHLAAPRKRLGQPSRPDSRPVR